MPTYQVKGTGQSVSLTDRDFIARGGEKSVFAKGDIAYCIYHNPKAALPSQKIKELSVLDHPGVIRPLNELLDSRKQHCGETMPFVSDSSAPQDKSIKPMVLCHLFTNSFRRKNGIDETHVTKISDAMLEIMRHCHSKGVVLVDPNETNWLVSSDLKRTYLIDTSCLQTPSYPGNVIKLAIRDWNQNCFNEQSDWYSMAVVLAWLWVGSHPYVTWHPKFQKKTQDEALEERMRHYISFFDKDTQFNRACRPLTSIPQALHRWLFETLQKGQRIEPPQFCGDSVKVSVPVKPVRPITSDNITLTLMTMTDIVRGTYARTPVRGITVEAKHENKRVSLRDVKSGIAIPISCAADHIFECDGRLYVVVAGSVNEIVFLEKGTIWATIKQVGTVADLPSLRVFPGCVIQNLMGKYVLSVFPESGKCYQQQLPELEGRQILDAKYRNHVLVVMSEQGGKYELRAYRLAFGYGGTGDTHVLSREFGEVNMTVTERSIAAVLLPNGDLSAFPARAIGGPFKERRVPFPNPDLTLGSIGPKVIAFSEKEAFEVSLK